MVAKEVTVAMVKVEDRVGLTVEPRAPAMAARVEEEVAATVQRAVASPAAAARATAKWAAANQVEANRAAVQAAAAQT